MLIGAKTMLKQYIVDAGKGAIMKNIAKEKPMKDLIERQAAIVQLSHNKIGDDDCDVIIQNDIETIKALPSAQPEPLTDKEQRIFLAAMGREEKVCEEVDRNYVREPYEDSLMRVCKEIRRKVKCALWV